MKSWKLDVCRASLDSHYLIGKCDKRIFLVFPFSFLFRDKMLLIREFTSVDVVIEAVEFQQFLFYISTAKMFKML